MDRKIEQNEAFMALDGVSFECLGIVALSRNHNRISFLGFTKTADFPGTGAELLKFALSQLDDTKEITSTVIKSDAEFIREERKLYELFGFIECADEIFEAGIPACLMKRTPAGRD